jgi:hypothetical protein
METIKLKTHVGSDGVLKLEVSVGITNQDLEVVVVVEPLTQVKAETDRAEWLAFIEATAGSLADNPIERQQ